jgi:hypothetical protein
MPSHEQLLNAARRLHTHLESRHYRRGLLQGPDYGVRFNWRAWRFLKSASEFFPWRDDYVFLQTQGYWVLANWALYEATGEQRFQDLAMEATARTLELQDPQGFWTYPLPERRHLIATVEGNWAAIALLATYARTASSDLLQGVIRWYDFLVTRIGFQDHGPGKAVNYFDRPRGKVPNNSVLTAWFFLRLWRAVDDDRFREHVDAMLNFVAGVQMSSGEIPYVVGSPYENARPHYLCYQYNSFQFLELARASRLAPESAASDILAKLAPFLMHGVTPAGASAADCFHRKPEVDYYTAVLAAALREVTCLGLAADSELSDRCYARLLSRQKADGTFIFSEGDYGFLRDRRSYPRSLAMTLFHLLLGAGAGTGFPRSKKEIG